MRKSEFAVLIPWQEDESKRPRLGDGLSRPDPKELTREFRLLVKAPGATPMRWITQAPSASKALTYAQNRWPHAHVELLS
jgi:hypothetical protein